MTWKEWVVTAVLLTIGFWILYAVSVWGARGYDNTMTEHTFDSEISAIQLMPVLMPGEFPSKMGETK